MTLESIQRALYRLQRTTNSIEVQQHAQPPEASAEMVAKWQRKWWVVSIAGTLVAGGVSVGVSYVVLKDAVAMDQEVVESFDTHNKDPQAHPQLVEAVQKSTEAIDKTSDAIGQISLDQCRQKKRSEYQFEFALWQSQLIECERRSCKRSPPKPESLQKLETDLLMGRVCKE